MESFNAMIAAASSPLGQIGRDLATVGVGPALVVLFLPVVLATISRRLLALAGTLLLAGAVLIAIAAPPATVALVAVGSYIASFMLALSALHARRRDRAIQAEIRGLRMEVDRLLIAEQRRVIVELTSVENAREPIRIAAE
jgi:hypothetical protein